MLKRTVLSNLQMRLITGVVIALFTLGVTWLGGWSFRFFCLCVGALILYEWNDIIKPYALKRVLLCIWFFYILFAFALLLKFWADWVEVVSWTLFSACVIAFYSLVLHKKGAKAALFQAGGFLYAALFPLSFVCLRGGLGLGESVGFYWVLFLYITVWASDIGAYIVGRCCGGPKLVPKISPNKTWSGAGGGVLCAIFTALCFVFFISGSFHLSSFAVGKNAILNPWLIIFVAFLLSLIAQMGDLLESWFKRLFGVKDSGSLLPGHGGIMDRIDGLLPAAVVFVCFLALYFC